MPSNFRDGKNKFYKKLNLPKETRTLLRAWRIIKQEISNDRETDTRRRTNSRMYK